MKTRQAARDTYNIDHLTGPRLAVRRRLETDAGLDSAVSRNGFLKSRLYANSLRMLIPYVLSIL
jgi:hypothetical protein